MSSLALSGLTEPCLPEECQSIISLIQWAQGFQALWKYTTLLWCPKVVHSRGKIPLLISITRSLEIYQTLLLENWSPQKKREKRSKILFWSPITSSSQRVSSSKFGNIGTLCLVTLPLLKLLSLNFWRVWTGRKQKKSKRRWVCWDCGLRLISRTHCPCCQLISVPTIYTTRRLFQMRLQKLGNLQWSVLARRLMRKLNQFYSSWCRLFATRSLIIRH